MALLLLQLCVALPAASAVTGAATVVVVCVLLREAERVVADGGLVYRITIQLTEPESSCAEGSSKTIGASTLEKVLSAHLH